MKVNAYPVFKEGYLIEEYATLAEKRGFKIDTGETRLRPSSARANWTYVAMSYLGVESKPERRLKADISSRLVTLVPG